GESAVLGEIFAERGLTLHGGGSWTRPRWVGLAKARVLPFFSRPGFVAQVRRLGLVSLPLTDEEMDKTVDEWAQTLADGPTLALSVMKKELSKAYESSFAEAIETESLAQAFSFSSAEAREGMRAFLQRRPPRFRESHN